MFSMRNCERGKDGVPAIYCTTDSIGEPFVQKLFEIPTDLSFALRSQIIAQCAE